ncbi:formyltransferase family protein [Pseudomonas mosselii]|uniref:formyltransferase family protein n=1 Tax=Pseudomonas mosselii TaxID=78327 RepID=UPI0024499400|nr:formyltransferase family protein [Pseudomonas mosselii]MDH1657964.1 formyltransferase family protein [Pseudomonas mosselii]MDH1714892.1 formyltransferase family protein [Pseudomonas mosselii]MDH1721637.1 formyltransferase family protein [Pseudomonas mosselii]
MHTEQTPICLLSYDTPHLKTAQVMMGLHNRGFRNIDLLVMPFTKRPERTVAFQHRPSQFEGPDPRSLVAFNGGKIIEYEHWRALTKSYQWFLVCGSNLIEPEFSNCGRILNVHAGLIPSVRGLDSFKWAILNGLPLGNTLHKIDEHADAGEVLYHLPTPVFQEDDIQTLARRHYENEIWMLTNFDSLLNSKSIMTLPEQPATMRMPIAKESEMLSAFDAFKAKYTQDRGR